MYLYEPYFSATIFIYSHISSDFAWLPLPPNTKHQTPVLENRRGGKGSTSPRIWDMVRKSRYNYDQEYRMHTQGTDSQTMSLQDQGSSHTRLNQCFGILS